MTHPEPTPVADAGNPETRWNWLYRIGGAAALIIVLLTVVQIIVFVASPPPSTVIDFFSLFQKNALLGLLAMDLLLMADYALWGLMYLALYAALRRVSESFMVIATALGLLGVAVFFASNTAFNMLSLSQQYAAATTDIQRNALLAAGEAMLAIFNGTAFQASYIFLSLAPLTIAVVMLRSPVFGKATAWVGIAGNVLGFGLFVPGIGILLALLSVVVLAIWNVLIARALFRLVRRQ
jgi:hypothetical protein